MKIDLNNNERNYFEYKVFYVFLLNDQDAKICAFIK